MLRILYPFAVLLLAFMTLFSIPGEETGSKAEHFINGVSFVAPSREFSANPFLELSRIHSDWVSIMPYAFSNGNTPGVHFDTEHQWWGETSKGTIRTIQLAKESGLKVLLKPHVWVSGQGWTGDFRLDSEADWSAWEASYRKYIMNHARIADSMQLEAFCVGLEFKQVLRDRPDFFGGLIVNVRKAYDGYITYAANWDNFQNVTFWEQVDFIGINAYFPLSQSITPSENELNDSWSREKERLQALSAVYKKPIVFTEFGYRSIDKAAGNQWEMDHHRKYKGAPNFEAQTRAYRCLFENFWDEPWFSGGFLWKWYPEQRQSHDPNNTDYTPQYKPVEKLIAAWYKKHQD